MLCRLSQFSVWHAAFVLCSCTKKPRCPSHDNLSLQADPGRLAAEAVQSATLALECVDHVQGCHGLAASMLSVSDSIADYVLQENLEHTTGLLICRGGIARHMIQKVEPRSASCFDCFKIEVVSPPAGCLRCPESTAYKKTQAPNPAIDLQMSPEIRLTPPRRARRRIAGLVIP